MGLGWAAGSSSVFNSREARGLGLFVGKISLPALILTNLVALDLSVIRWGFLVSVLVSKSIVFGLVLTLDFLFNRSISRAALFAIYSTQVGPKFFSKSSYFFFFRLMTLVWDCR